MMCVRAFLISWLFVPRELVPRARARDTRRRQLVLRLHIRQIEAGKVQDTDGTLR